MAEFDKIVVNGMVTKFMILTQLILHEVCWLITSIVHEFCKILADFISHFEFINKSTLATKMFSRNSHQFRFKVLYFVTFIAMTILSTLPIVNANVLLKSGKCSKGSMWALSLERENSMIDVDFEAENRVLDKQNWDITIRNNC